MTTATIIFLLASCLVLASAYPRSAAKMMFEKDFRPSTCRICDGDECNIPPGNCKHGEFKDSCGSINCRRPPGHKCSENYECHNGNPCICGICSSCVATLINPETIGYQCHSPSAACMGK